MDGELVTLDRLREWLGYERRSAIIRWLDAHGVQWKPAANGDPVTTCGQINAALGGAGTGQREANIF